MSGTQFMTRISISNQSIVTHKVGFTSITGNGVAQ